MKKLFAVLLTLALALGLGCPALAAEEFEPLPEDWWMDEISAEADYGDPAQQYIEDHPDEIAALDVDLLLADWGYRDMTAAERFIENWYGPGEDPTLDEMVAYEYAQRRLTVENMRLQAEEYRAQYPDKWEAFDADSYFIQSYLSVGYYGDENAYMSYWCIHSREEFVDTMFALYININDTDDDSSVWWTDTDLPAEEPTLTLWVNGVASEAEVTAQDGATYADADALRDILGETAVPAGKTGLLPIRETARAAGWDVQWYGGGWRGVDREVQLWDRAAYEAALDQEFGPLNEFLAKALKAGGGALFSGAPVTSRRTVNAQWTAFSTLDGDRTFSVDLAADVTVGGGVMDATVTFDASALLGLLPENTLDALLRRADAGFTAAQLRQFLKAGVAEFIIDCNAGEAAWNIPLLALADRDLAGWQTGDLSALSELDRPLVSSLYQSMTNTASYSGAEYAAEDYENTVAVLKLFGGKARFSADGRGKTTYALTTDAVNEAMGELLARAGMDAPEFSAFKAFDVTYTLDDKGSVTAKAHIRPDVEGILAGLLGSEDGYYSAAGLLGLSMAGRDMELTAAMEGNAERSTATLELHQNNVGKLTVRSAAEAKTGSKPPRTVEDVVK